MRPRADFIALMDSDDICKPERIAAQVRFLSERPEVVLCCSDFSAFGAGGPVSGSYGEVYYSRCAPSGGGMKALYPNHGRLDITECLASPPGQTVVVPIHFGQVYEELALGNFVHPPTVLFRREVLNKVRSAPDPQIKIMCEWDWLVRV